METAEEALQQGPDVPEPPAVVEVLHEAQMNAVSSSTTLVATGSVSGSVPAASAQPDTDSKDKSVSECGNHPEDIAAVDVEPEDGRRKRRKESREPSDSGTGSAMSLRNHGKSTSSTGNGAGSSVDSVEKELPVPNLDPESSMTTACSDPEGGGPGHGNLPIGQNLPKVPPLKIVLPPPEQEKGKSSSSRQALPYVVSSSPPEVCDQKEDPSTSSGPRLDDGKQVIGSSLTTSEERSQRVTRSRAALASASGTGVCASGSGGGGSESSPGHDGSATRAGSRMEDEEGVNPVSEVHPRKRKLRPKESSSPDGSGNSSSASVAQFEDQPVLNCYEMYLNIRRQIDRRRRGMFVVQPKPPEGFKDYLMNRCSYVLAGNSASQLSVPMIPPPQSLTGSMRDLFVSQENERYRLRLQHIIEKDKLMLAVEQEIVRVYGNAARAVANQNVPLSVCSILKDEEVYNHVEPEQEEKERNTARTRYTGRLLLSWLQDVDDKWEKIKEAMLLRHHNEAESLHAVQKLDWEWKMKELGICDSKSTPVVDDINVPMVHIKPMHVQAALHRSGHRKGKY